MCKIGLTLEQTKYVAGCLDRLLADEYVLFTKLFKYHWNIVGPSFGPLHKLFEEQYELLFTVIDDVAERSRALGHKALGTLQEFQAHTRLVEKPGHNPSAEEMIADLVYDHETIICQLRKEIPSIEEINDQGTVDFLSGLVKNHEKMAWLLRAHIQ